MTVVVQTFTCQGCFFCTCESNDCKGDEKLQKHDFVGILRDLRRKSLDRGDGAVIVLMVVIGLKNS